MAIFVDHRVQAPYPGQNRDIQWHKTQGLLAVGSFNETTGAAVTVYQEEVVFFSLHIFCQQTLQFTVSYSSCGFIIICAAVTAGF